eukprot:6472692-Amphidinium_carterae.1
MSRVTASDSVHKHHRLHSCPDSVNLAIHTRWNVQSHQPAIYNLEAPVYLLAWIEEHNEPHLGQQ